MNTDQINSFLLKKHNRDSKIKINRYEELLVSYKKEALIIEKLIINSKAKMESIISLFDQSNFKISKIIGEIYYNSQNEKLAIRGEMKYLKDDFFKIWSHIQFLKEEFTKLDVEFDTWNNTKKSIQFRLAV